MSGPNTRSYLTVCKQMNSASFKNDFLQTFIFFIFFIFTNVCLLYMYWALNNLQRLICHKTQLKEHPIVLVSPVCVRIGCRLQSCLICSYHVGGNFPT